MYHKHDAAKNQNTFIVLNPSISLTKRFEGVDPGTPALGVHRLILGATTERWTQYLAFLEFRCKDIVGRSTKALRVALRGLIFGRARKPSFRTAPMVIVGDSTCNFPMHKVSRTCKTLLFAFPTCWSSIWVSSRVSWRLQDFSKGLNSIRMSSTQQNPYFRTYRLCSRRRKDARAIARAC